MKHLKFFKTLAILVLLLTTVLSNVRSIDSNPPERTVKILTIGNSFAENACYYLKQITESVEGCNIVIGKANIGGCDLEKHAKLIKECEQDTSLKPYKGKSLEEWLVTDEWDVVTIQQVSSLSFKKESYQPYADQICDYIKKYAPQAQIYIHETWAYAPDCQRLERFGISSEQMYKKLEKNYRDLSKRYDAPVLRSGDAFCYSHKKNSELDLWHHMDRFHASIFGCYLAGCVWFEELFDKSPALIKFVPEGMSTETASYLKAIAAK